jgi:hypothetical protein
VRNSGPTCSRCLNRNLSGRLPAARKGRTELPQRAFGPSNLIKRASGSRASAPRARRLPAGESDEPAHHEISREALAVRGTSRSARSEGNQLLWTKASWAGTQLAANTIAARWLWRTGPRALNAGATVEWLVASVAVELRASGDEPDARTHCTERLELRHDELTRDVDQARRRSSCRRALHRASLTYERSALTLELRFPDTFTQCRAKERFSLIPIGAAHLGWLAAHDARS